jgi:hypothetical protein
LNIIPALSARLYAMTQAYMQALHTAGVRHCTHLLRRETQRQTEGPVQVTSLLYDDGVPTEALGRTALTLVL